MRKLYPFQETCVDFHLRTPYSINACEMGLGKSVMAMRTAKAAGVSRLAVFGPKYLERVWEMEAEAEKIPVTYFPYSILTKFKPKDLAGFPMRVAEEAAYLKNPEAIRTEAFVALLRACLPERLLLLTGTPIKNRVPDIWTLIGMTSLDPNEKTRREMPVQFKRWRGFCRHFCRTELVQMRARTFEKFYDLKPDKVEEFRQLLNGRMIRFLAKDVLHDLPDLIEKYVLSDLKPVPDLLEEFEAYQKGRLVDPKAKSLSALLKTEATVERVKAILDSGYGPVLVFSDHVEPVRRIAAEFKTAVYVTGQTPAYARADAVERFQNGRVEVLSATIGAMATGVTLTKARHVVFNDLSWVPSDNEQALKRIHRIGQKETCMAHYMVASKTDEYIAKTLRQKAAAIAEALSP